jgi:HEAT repeat protein
MFEKLAIISVFIIGSAPVLAGPGAAEPKAHVSLNLDRIKKALDSGDEERTLSALDEIEQTGERKAAPLVEGLLIRGASSKIVVRALAVAGALGQQSSSAAIAPYVQHRIPEVRRAAAHSLTRTKGPAAVQALSLSLRSNDAELRGSAAEGLGALGAKEAVPDLFVVLNKEVPEAAGAIGTLCNVDECKRFSTLLGRLPFDVMESGFLPILLRTDSDVSDGLKIQLIEQLRRMATAKASDLLSTALASFPAKGSPKVKLALDAAAHGHNPTRETP